MGFVLRSLGRRANAECGGERVVDLGRVVRRTIVEEQGERTRAGGRDAALEGLDDGRGVLLVANGETDERAAVRVDVELDVDDEARAVDDDGDLHAVADPLRAGEERPERAANRELVRTSAGATRDLAGPVEVRGSAPMRSRVERDTEVAPHVIAEVAEAAAPASPRLHDGQDLRVLVAARSGGSGLDRWSWRADRAASP